ncbi:RrF2 family transcriptional regulator [Rubrimonas cliftonensis]|uniref:Transcriptional regulator, BadM/Rrf2 family n=1 Tax=Rubrimonas cliftonensis TaxID=89524 RepID=A0A1H3YF94_9RHOB|nr:Rrf2 family transcriptional regulator [Rubrimonas cliftonensis]SEA10235.1 transcriptional regulator, BadM/Rrf2 family [Rubrimonas cliftonensis]
MRLTMRSNLAMRTLMQCAVNVDRTVQARDVASACNASVNHVAQVVSRLAEAGLLATARGRGGGLRLARPAREISVGAVLRRFEADVPFAECMAATGNTCPLPAACRLRGALSRALEAFYCELDRLTLADLVDDNAALAALLALPQRDAPGCAAGTAT